MSQDSSIGWNEQPQHAPLVEDLAHGKKRPGANSGSGSANRPVSSPLQEATSARSVSEASSSSSTGEAAGMPSVAPSQQRMGRSYEQVPTTSTATNSAAPGSASPGEQQQQQQQQRVRTPNPAKRVPTSPAIEEFRQAVARDVLRDEAKKAASAAATQTRSRDVTAPVTAPTATATVIPSARPQSSPQASPTMPSSAVTSTTATPRPSQHHRSGLRGVDGKPMMPRTASIDSTASSISTATASSQKPQSSSAYRGAQEGSAPEDVAALISAAGSPEAAVQKLIGEKNQAASHNAQLWRLVEKQRAMILGLNKDLDKSMKEKDRYKRKLKDHLVQSQSAPILTSAGQNMGAPDAREDSKSPALAASTSSRDASSITAVPSSLRDMSIDSRKVSDASDAASSGPGRSDTPQDSMTAPSSGTFPRTPRSAGSGNSNKLPARDADQALSGPSSVLPAGGVRNIEAASDRSKPAQSPTEPQKTPTLPSPSTNTWTSPKTANRKAPPAPLQLSPKPIDGLPTLMNNIMDASDSEYEADPASARSEHERRGRRKTREEDDREREAIAREELEARSRSKKKSKSKSKAPVQVVEASSDLPGSTAVAAPQPAAVQPRSEPKSPTHAYHNTNDPAALLRQRAMSDAAGMLQKSTTVPSLLSPGLPMSPRPSDKPLNSPMPRAPKAGINVMPMSPKAGFPGGLPLSPRAPRQPLPMPPQTPLSFTSPHLARAEMYHQQQQSAPQPVVRKLSSEKSPERGRPSTSSDPNPKAPGEVYKGLVVEQYPDLLLPPNALPSVYVKTSSPRMKPSRMSYIAPKHAESDSPVLTLAVYERSEGKQLWRVEKTVAALVMLDTQIKSVCPFRDRMPDKAIFSGHSPAKIDARRTALDHYFDRMLDAIESEKAATVLCRFLSNDAIAADSTDQQVAGQDARPDTPVSKQQRPSRAGYLTKRGKNFGGWKARYFVLDGPQLKYFEAPGGAHLGSIKLQNAQIGKQSAGPANAPQEDEDNQFRHAFLILEPKKKDSNSLVRHVLCAESDEERDAWVDALLQYVDFRDDEEDSMKGTQYVRPGPDLSGARSPRLQKSLNDLRPPSRSGGNAHLMPDSMRTVNYNETSAGEAPIIGGMLPKSGTPSPPLNESFTPTQESVSGAHHPTISGPTNLQVISNAGEWGMKPPPTPQPKDHGKDKKRSMFAAFRGRSSSDLAPSMVTPSLPSESRSANGRAVFGVPLAEAVEYARPADIDTELPAVVYRCIEYLLAKDAIAEEGIFRLSGSNTVIKQLKERFSSEGDVNLVADDHHYDVHAVASLLKLYLRELPSSILTRDLHLEFLQVYELHGREKVAALNGLVTRLPRCNRVLLGKLSEFLGEVVGNAEVNKMNVRNGEIERHRGQRRGCANTFRSRHRLRAHSQRPRAAHLLVRRRPNPDLRRADGA